MATKIKWISFGLLLCLTLFVVAVVWPRAEYRKAAERYPVGSLLEDCLRKTIGKPEIRRPAITFPEGGPTPSQKEIFTFYDVIIEDEGVYLEFNYYQKLTAVRSLGHPLIRRISRKLNNDR